jgi:hypothetical protein
VDKSSDNSPHQQDGSEVGTMSALTFLAGMWLVLAPLALDYPAVGTAFDASSSALIARRPRDPTTRSVAGSIARRV